MILFLVIFIQIMLSILSGFLIGKPIEYILKYLNFDILNKTFLGLPIYFEIGVICYVLIGIIYVFFDTLKDRNKIKI